MTDFERYENSLSGFKFPKGKSPKTLELSDGRKCVIVWNGSQHKQNRGWVVKIFDKNEKEVFDNWPNVWNDRPKNTNELENWILYEEREELKTKAFHQKMRNKRNFFGN